MAFSEARSMRVVRVENPPVLYESPVTKTVTAANRPSRETRVRLGVPARLKECNGSKSPIKAYGLISCEHIPGCLKAQSRFIRGIDALTGQVGRVTGAACSVECNEGKISVGGAQCRVAKEQVWTPSQLRNLFVIRDDGCGRIRIPRWLTLG